MCLTKSEETPNHGEKKWGKIKFRKKKIKEKKKKIYKKENIYIRLVNRTELPT